MVFGICFLEFSSGKQLELTNQFVEPKFSSMKKYLVEFIGTFFLVLTIVTVVNDNAPGNFLPPLAIGSALMVMVYAGGHISGAHYNPAVTLGVLMRGKIAGSDVPGYIVAQILGAIVAAVVGATLLGRGDLLVGGAMPDSTPAAFVAELLGTFALVWVVLQTATTKSTAGNSYYGLAIGFTVLAMAYALGGFGTGGCFNPAVAIGAAFNGLAGWGTAILALSSNFVGAALAALAFNATYTRLGGDD